MRMFLTYDISTQPLSDSCCIWPMEQVLYWCFYRVQRDVYKKKTETLEG